MDDTALTPCVCTVNNGALEFLNSQKKIIKYLKMVKKQWYWWTKRVFTDKFRKRNLCSIFKKHCHLFCCVEICVFQTNSPQFPWFFAPFSYFFVFEMRTYSPKSQLCRRQYRPPLDSRVPAPAPHKEMHIKDYLQNKKMDIIDK